MDIISLQQYLQTTPNISLALLFFLFFVTILLTKLGTKRHNYPPGPKGLPIIGNMGLVDQLNHRGLAALAQIYGGLFHLKVGYVHMVAVSTAEMAQQVLQAQDKIFSNRPATTAISYLTYDRADMAFAHYGPFWRQMRKICVTKVFSRKRAGSWVSVRDEIDSFIKSIESRIGYPVNVGEIVLGLTKNITYKAAFGSMSQEGQVYSMVGVDSWKGFPQKARKCSCGSLDGFIDKIIDDHINKKKSKITRKADDDDDDFVEVEDDMVDELMEFYDENGANNIGQNSSISITRNNIKALIMDVMFGGTETVASAIEWVMAELMHSLKDLKKVQQELVDVVGFNRKINESDLEKLTYLKCVIKETLRLHPPIPLLLHETTTDTVVNGYKIPARARVMVNVWAIGRDETAWAEPNTFNPSRFLENDAPDFRGSNFEFIPFGSGRRSCPGMQLGLYALGLSVAHLCHSFDWELPNGMEPDGLDMNDGFGLTAPRAVQLVAIPKHRLNVPLF
ncbi:hypothetical protein CASFOL_007213 [Castilleja foliolosa]|uniref:Cytochrome P450 n=1 Tax=Castilleja foliolosa TaxID=1961234 RepID=A0ABD3E8M2_9LAMI